MSDPTPNTAGNAYVVIRHGDHETGTVMCEACVRRERPHINALPGAHVTIDWTSDAPCEYCGGSR